MSALPSILISELMHKDIDSDTHTLAYAIMYLNNHIFDLEKKVTNGSRNFIGVRKKCQISCHVIFVFFFSFSLPLSLTTSSLNPDHCRFYCKFGVFIWISWSNQQITKTNQINELIKKNCVWQSRRKKNQLLHQIYAFADALNTHLIDSYQTVHSNVVRFNEIYI